MTQADRDKWNGKYERAAPSVPSAVLVEFADYLPTDGSALDIAGGAGRHSIWLAQRGLDVTLVDISEKGIQIAEQRAVEAGVSLSTVCQDLDDTPLPAGPYDLIVSVCFLCRDILQQVPRLLKPGGRVIVVQPTKTNLIRHNRPPEPFLLYDGELAELLPTLRTIHYHEGWSADERYDAVLVAQRDE